MALALGRSSVTSRMAPSRRVERHQTSAGSFAGTIRSAAGSISGSRPARHRPGQRLALRQTISGLMSSSLDLPAFGLHNRRCATMASIAASTSAFGPAAITVSRGYSFRPRKRRRDGAARRRQQQRGAVLEQLDQHAAAADRHHRTEHRIPGDADDQFGDCHRAPCARHRGLCRACRAHPLPA